MQPFPCPVCAQMLFFENTSCLQCNSVLGYRSDTQDMVVAGPDDRFCANQNLANCNWLLTEGDADPLCVSCRLTTIRPADDDVAALAAFADAEAAKRRLIHQLLGLGLPVIDREVDPERGVAFEMLSARAHAVTTGHQAGVITLDLSESDDAHREFVRQQLGEPYRTVLGHLRHEIGHYYWPLLVQSDDDLEACRALFGDERISYEDALSNHYGGDGDGADWTDVHVSEYASMHPFEDWAETFAHFLHIDDGLRTAEAFGIAVGEPSLGAGRAVVAHRPSSPVNDMVADWLSLSLGLNAMSRSIGQIDLYPFVLSDTVIDKIDFVHRMVRSAS